MSLLLFLLLPVGAPAPQEHTTAAPFEFTTVPPASLALPGGVALLGTTRERAIEFVRAVPERLERLAAEVPAHGRPVEPLYLMRTEVTHGQFFEFVRATGAAPLLEWGRPAVEAARLAFLEAEEAARRKAREERRRPPERQTFDEVAWWREHGREAPWRLDPDLARRPATYVDHYAARAFADWVGMRLPTEAELALAARGESEQDYPWGSAFEAPRVVSRETAETSQPVGSRSPTGAGFFDLVGNVWEWTDSPFQAYPGFEPLVFELEELGRRRMLRSDVRFDPDRRVLFGGSWRQGADGVRVASRFRAWRSLARDAVGLRCAASPRPGLDRARFLGEAAGGDYDAALLSALDRWRVRPGPEAGEVLILGYDCLLFLPQAELEAREPQDLGRAVSAGRETSLGLFHSSLPLTEPALEPGTYKLSFGPAPPGHGTGHAEGWVWRDASGLAVGFQAAVPRAGRAETPPPATSAGEHLILRLRVPLASKRRLLEADLQVRSPGAGEGSWRE